jgi:hypothetical protein
LERVQRRLKLNRIFPTQEPEMVLEDFVATGGGQRPAEDRAEAVDYTTDEALLPSALWVAVLAQLTHAHW